MDRAALDAALALGVPFGGWCPAGMEAEDGPIDPRYNLRPTPRPARAQRTLWNVRDADATLIVSPLPLSGGTALTLRLALRLGRRHLVVDPGRGPGPAPDSVAAITAWLANGESGILNVAGPPESEHPGIYDIAYQLLLRALSRDLV